MYQHLSETAKGVLQAARLQSNQEYIGTEHILLAILDLGIGIGAQVLHNCGVTYPAAKEQIDQFTKTSLDQSWVLGRLPGTPHFKQVIAYAIEEAEKARDTKVGTEYLLLGLLLERGCVAQRTLGQLGVTLELARTRIAELQGRPKPKGH